MEPLGEPSVPVPLDNLVTPPPAAANPSNADADYREAQNSYKNQDYESALRQFDAYLRRYPGTDACPNAQYWKAKSQQSTEEYSAAVTEFEKLRDNYPTSTYVPYAIHQQAVCHARLGQTSRAIKLLEEVVEKYPTTPPADQAEQDLSRLKQN